MLTIRTVDVKITPVAETADESMNRVLIDWRKYLAKILEKSC